MDVFSKGWDTGVESLISALFTLGVNPFSVWFYIQIGLIVLFAIAGRLFQRWLSRNHNLNEMMMGRPWPVRRLVRVVSDNVWLIVFLILVLVCRQAMLAYTWPSRSYMLSVASQLAVAWLFINIAAALIRNNALYRFVVVVAWTVAALSILGLLDGAKEALDSVGVQLGAIKVTPLLVVKAIALLALTLWLVFTLSKFIEARLHKADSLTPSVRVLIAQLLKFSLIVVAIVIALSSAGIDLSAFALFSGALGVGIGFGLQKVVSNFVSGLILLTDKSIKPGDVISVGESFGWVGAMSARYTSVQTREGSEYLIPNEDLITRQVVNWSFSNHRVRLEAKFGVSYDSDPHHIIRVAQEAVSNVPRVLKEPPARCNMAGFGDSSLDFSMRFWITDPTEGLGNIRSDVYLALWDAFKREGISIPYPVRDLRLPEGFLRNDGPGKPDGINPSSSPSGPQSA
ncbi:MAG: mechanosensitive ion channel [Hyphomicrobiales bacterium]|nr:mechanosensitive ion channel [Hyphomicrobiales bacterium]